MNGINQSFQSFRSTFLVQSAIGVVLLGSVAGCGQGQGSSTTIPGIDNFTLQVLDQQLYVSFVATALNWNEGISTAIPGLNGATVSISPDLQSSGTVFQFAIGLDTILGNSNGQGQPAGLPDGSMIPDITTGVLPRWEVTINKYSFYLYLSDDAFGIYLPLPMINAQGEALTGTVSLPINDDRGNLLGKVYAVPSATAGDSGVLLLLPYLGGQSTSASN